MAIGIGTSEPTSPRQRLGAMLNCAVGMQEFLPARASDAIDLKEAALWTRDNRAELSRRLSRVRGRLQLTLGLEVPDLRRPPRTAGCGRAWLAERRAERAEATALRQEAALRLARLASGVPECGWMERSSDRAVCLDLLLNRTQVPTAIERIRKAASSVTPDDAPQITVTGPWPPVSFAWEAA